MRWTGAVILLAVLVGLGASVMLREDPADTRPAAAHEVQGAPLDAALPEEARPPRTEPPVLPTDPDDDTPVPMTFEDLTSFTYIPPDRPVESVPVAELDEDTQRWVMNRKDTGGAEIPADQIPADILALNGRVISIEGYLDPYTLKSDSVANFLLTQHPGGCCFGAFADMNQWIDVKAPQDMGIQLMPYTPILVTGRLTVGEVYDEYGYVLSLYRMEADTVEEVVY